MPFSTCEFVKVAAVKVATVKVTTLYLRQQIKICLILYFMFMARCIAGSILIIVQRDATQSSLFIILQVHSTCFRYQPHPSSGVHKTVTTVSGTGHIFCAAASLQRGQAWPSWREADGCGWHLKHVEWTCRITNRQLCVASRWTIININIYEVSYCCRLFVKACLDCSKFCEKLIFLNINKVLHFISLGTDK